MSERYGSTSPGDSQPVPLPDETCNNSDDFRLVLAFVIAIVAACAIAGLFALVLWLARPVEAGPVVLGAMHLIRRVR